MHKSTDKRIYLLFILKELLARAQILFPTELIRLVIVMINDYRRGISCRFGNLIVVHDDRTYIWDKNFQKKASQKSNLPNVFKLSQGDEHAVAVTADGLYTWGTNAGQLGLGKNIIQNKTEPTKINLKGQFKESDIIDICCGGNHTACLTKSGLFMWGYNNEGQSGFESRSTIYEPTKLVIPGIEIKSVTCGNSFTIAISNSPNKLFVWGANGCSQLGLGSRSNKYNPCELTMPESIIGVVSGSMSSHTVALAMRSHILYVWGNNFHYRLGLGDDCEYRTTPAILILADPVKSVVCGGTHTIALIDLNTVYIWGANSHNQLGSESKLFYSRPHKISLGFAIENISCGTVCTFILTQNRKIHYWGSNQIISPYTHTQFINELEY